MREDAPPHMYATGLVDIPLSKNRALVADWHLLRKLAGNAGYDLHQCNDLFELAHGDWRHERNLVRFKTLEEVRDFLMKVHP